MRSGKAREADADILDLALGALEYADPLAGAAVAGVAFDRDQRAADHIGDETGVTGRLSGIDVEYHARHDEQRVRDGFRRRNDDRVGRGLRQLPGTLDASASRRRIGNTGLGGSLAEAPID